MNISLVDTFKHATRLGRGKTMATPQPTLDEQDAEDSWDLSGAIARNGMIQTVILITIVSVIGWAVPARPPIFALSPPLFEPWWALLTSAYAHISPAHYAGNVTMIALVGGLISLSSSAFRFHLFFAFTGITAGVIQVSIASAFGEPLAVIGSSGAAFALLGYLIAGNAISDSVLGFLNRRSVAAVTILIGAYLTVTYSAPGSALMAHFSGALLGMVAGRYHLLATK